MQIQLTPYHARMVANNIDYNRNGKIESRELKFRNNSKRMVDYDRNGRVSTEELAYSLMRGDIYIAEGRKAYPTYNYGGYPRPGYGPVTETPVTETPAMARPLIAMALMLPYLSSPASPMVRGIVQAAALVKYSALPLSVRVRVQPLVMPLTPSKNLSAAEQPSARLLVLQWAHC